MLKCGDAFKEVFRCTYAPYDNCARDPYDVRDPFHMSPPLSLTSVFCQCCFPFAPMASSVDQNRTNMFMPPSAGLDKTIWLKQLPWNVSLGTPRLSYSSSLFVIFFLFQMWI